MVQLNLNACWYGWQLRSCVLSKVISLTFNLDGIGIWLFNLSEIGAWLRDSNISSQRGLQSTRYFSLLDWIIRDHPLCYKISNLFQLRMKPCLHCPVQNILRLFWEILIFYLSFFVWFRFGSKAGYLCLHHLQGWWRCRGKYNQFNSGFHTKGTTHLEEKAVSKWWCIIWKGQRKVDSLRLQPGTKTVIVFKYRTTGSTLWVQEANIYLELNTWFWPM